MPEPHHYSDYGFDPQIDYFQVRPRAPLPKTPLCKLLSLRLSLSLGIRGSEAAHKAGRTALDRLDPLQALEAHFEGPRPSQVQEAKVVVEERAWFLEADKGPRR